MKMPIVPSTEQILRTENAKLRARLEEAEHRITAMHDAHGERAGNLTAVRDITQLRQREDEKAEALLLLDVLLAHVSVGFAYFDCDLRYVRINERFAEITGLPVAEHIGRHVAEVISTIAAGVREVTERISATGQPVLDHEFAGEAANALEVIRHWTVSGYPVRGQRGEIAGYGTAVEEVTARKEVDAVLHQSEERLRLAIAASDLGTWHWDLRTGALEWSARCLTIFGIPPLTVMSYVKFLEALHPEDRARAHDAVQLALRDRSQYRLEVRSVWPDGSVHWAVSLGRAFFDASGVPIRMEGIAFDSTERKRVEEEHRLLASIVENSRDFIGISDTHGNPLFGNRAAMELVGLQDLEQVRRIKIIDYFIPEQKAFVAEVVMPDVIEKGRWRGELTMQHFVTGAKIPVLYDLFRVDDPATGEPTNFATVTRDLTASKQGEETLRASDAMLNVALRDTGILLYTTDADLRYRWLHNPHPAFRREDVIGRRDEDLLPAEQAAPLTALKRRVLDTGVGDTGEVAVESGGIKYVYNLVVEPSRDPGGKVVGVTVAAMDITATKQAEADLRRLAAELAEVDQRKDVFLATLAHELRNPLAPIRNGLQIMKLAPDNAESVEKVRVMMDRQLTQLVRLVDDLLDVSRITRGKVELRKERVDLKVVIDAAVETSRPAIEKAGHELVVIVTDEPTFVDGDAARLVQVVSNLLHNSAKYTHRGGQVRLTLGREDGTAVVSVKDNGIGIPSAMIGRVFEMFAQLDQTLEKTTGGLGIGLSLAKALLEMHDGTLEAHSDGEGMGSEFMVRLPVVMDMIVRSDRPDGNTSQVVLSALRRILVVDDNVDSADSLVQMLKMLGNEVRAANDGEAGIGMAAQFRPDLVFMDIGMPKLNGYEAARRIRQHPWGRSMMLVALTGWGQEDDRKKSADAGFDHHLVKPVEVDALMKLMSSR